MGSAWGQGELGEETWWCSLWPLMPSPAQCTIPDPFHPPLGGRQQVQQHPLALTLALTHQTPLATHRPPSSPSVSLGSEGGHNSPPSSQREDSSLPLRPSGSWKRGSRRLGWSQYCAQTLGLVSHGPHVQPTFTGHPGRGTATPQPRRVSGTCAFCAGGPAPLEQPQRPPTVPISHREN